MLQFATRQVARRSPSRLPSDYAAFLRGDNLFSRFRERNAHETRFRTVPGNGLFADTPTRVGPMIRKEYEYRINAIRSLELARRTACPADKARLLKLAEDWLDLANLTHRQSGQRVRKIGEHPITRVKLGTRDQRAA